MTAELGLRTIDTSGLAGAVSLLPALPPADPMDRYAIRHVTMLWLAADKSKHTQRAYFADLAKWLTWCDRTRLDPLTARRADVDAWKATLTVVGRDGLPKPASASTLSRILAGVSSWYHYLQSNDVIDRNPFSAVSRPKRAKASPLPALDEHSTARLLDYVETRARTSNSEVSWRDCSLIALLFYTGLRVSGITEATVSDFTSDAGHHILRYTSKGGQRDFVPLVAPVLRPLQEYLTLRASRENVPVSQLHGPLLVTLPHPKDPNKRGGKALRQRDVWSVLRKSATHAGLPAAQSISPHTARRTTGTLLLAHNVPVQKVQDLLGHADIRTTRDRYDAHRHKLDSSPVHTLAQLLAQHRE